MLQKVQSRQIYGLYRHMPELQRLARSLAIQLGINKIVNGETVGADGTEDSAFKASRHFIVRFAERHGYAFRNKTTKKQQTITSFLVCWSKWIHPIRSWLGTLGLVTPNHYIKSFSLWNADEWACEPASYNFKHLASKHGQMVNSQELHVTVSTQKRYCTVTGIVPQSGFVVDC